jgi:hypothetical protein
MKAVQRAGRSGPRLIANKQQTTKLAHKNLSYCRAFAFRNAAQRRFEASMIALRPAALSLRFLRPGAAGEAAPVCFLATAHLLRWAAAILERAAADIWRPTGVGALPSGALGFNIWRSSAI